jgi:hypothetical protein
LARARDVQGKNMIRRGERSVDVAAVFRQRVTNVAVDLFTRKRRARFDGLFGVRHRRHC